LDSRAKISYGRVTAGVRPMFTGTSTRVCVEWEKSVWLTVGRALSNDSTGSPAPAMMATR